MMREDFSAMSTVNVCRAIDFYAEQVRVRTNDARALAQRWLTKYQIELRRRGEG